MCAYLYLPLSLQINAAPPKYSGKRKHMSMSQGDVEHNGFLPPGRTWETTFIATPPPPPPGNHSDVASQVAETPLSSVSHNATDEEYLISRRRRHMTQHNLPQTASGTAIEASVFHQHSPKSNSCDCSRNPVARLPAPLLYLVSLCVIYHTQRRQMNYARILIHTAI